MSGATSQPPAIMTSPVFRYAVLVVLTVVVIMGAGVCYRTRSYQRRALRPGGEVIRITPSAMVPPRDWGPTPKLFDVYLHPPRKDKPESDWDEMMPISVTRGTLDASGASSMARVSIMLRMPLPEPYLPQALEPPPDDDDEQHPLPHLEIGLSDVGVLLTDAKASPNEPDSEGGGEEEGIVGIQE
ncbi:Polyketide beta-ketoacyl-synthase [Mycena venus]|uniref:Polyketide beta-ketoacyl-synthase n=1 Tax=Mycena venus TaxID=2733690 RepID=A0A8H6YYD1_9AGAR|nr:Polyketide beta-ketoacyl-synthase [Mycena venus]